MKTLEFIKKSLIVVVALLFGLGTLTPAMASKGGGADNGADHGGNQKSEARKEVKKEVRIRDNQDNNDNDKKDVRIRVEKEVKKELLFFSQDLICQSYPYPPA